MLELRGIGIRRGQFALTNVNLRLSAGEYFVLLGPSGAGKTMLLEVAAGLESPDSGRLFWDGRDMTDSPPERRGFAMVYQDYALFPHLTVAGNIRYGVSGPDPTAQARDVAARMRIKHLLARSVGTLSGGECQRVALARAMAARPRLLLLDEPLSALPTTVRADLRQELKQLQHQSGTTFLHVTHDIDEAMALSDRVGVLLNGRLHPVGPADEVLRDPSDPAVAEFLGATVCHG